MRASCFVTRVLTEAPFTTMKIGTPPSIVSDSISVFRGNRHSHHRALALTLVDSHYALQEPGLSWYAHRNRRGHRLQRQQRITRKGWTATVSQSENYGVDGSGVQQHNAGGGDGGRRSSKERSTRAEGEWKERAGTVMMVEGWQRQWSDSDAATGHASATGSGTGAGSGSGGAMTGNWVRGKGSEGERSGQGLTWAVRGGDNGRGADRGGRDYGRGRRRERESRGSGGPVLIEQRVWQGRRGGEGLPMRRNEEAQEWEEEEGEGKGWEGWRQDDDDPEAESAMANWKQDGMKWVGVSTAAAQGAGRGRGRGRGAGGSENVRGRTGQPHYRSSHREMRLDGTAPEAGEEAKKEESWLNGWAGSSGARAMEGVRDNRWGQAAGRSERAMLKGRERKEKNDGEREVMAGASLERRKGARSTGRMVEGGRDGVKAAEGMRKLHTPMPLTPENATWIEEDEGGHEAHWDRRPREGADADGVEGLVEQQRNQGRRQGGADKVVMPPLPAGARMGEQQERERRKGERVATDCDLHCPHFTRYMGGSLECDAERCSVLQCSAVPCRAVRCSAVQCSAVKRHYLKNYNRYMMNYIETESSVLFQPAKSLSLSTLCQCNPSVLPCALSCGRAALLGLLVVVPSCGGRGPGPS